MKLVTQSPKKALKAFLKQKPLRSQIDLFKGNLIALLDKISLIEKLPKDESEEHLKNNLRDFLRDTYYKDSNAINTKDKKDLVIHLNKTTDTNVAVIVEAKRPTNIGEMITADNPNKKALHELILYYLNERNDAGNNQLKQLVATNINEWFIIDANYFDKHIYRNTQIRKLYETKQNDKKDNPWFYEEVTKIISKIDVEIPCVYFDIREFETFLCNTKKDDDKELIALFKILSPEHLLKIATPNDSNSLDEKFYKELLHIIGLEEAKEGGKSIIRRKEENRNTSSLIELSIEALKTEDTFHRVPDIKIYGENKEEQTFNIALELCITWINRILFLKLLEGQLITYHGSKEYSFLNYETIHDFDELFKLFHKVLAVNIPERSEAIKTKYSRVPYLNSSLFEISDLEDQTIKINSLENDGKLELISTTVLRDIKKKTDKLPPLEYLFRFLDAYDFASEGTEDIQEDNKTLINASVLGKVFEKINGYKDGSIFTPAFITMYMCRQSIRLAVVEKFNEVLAEKGKQLFDKFDDIKNYTSRLFKTDEILKANEIINSIRICDPAVGSGHFLVSALNEIIAIKSELGILADEKGNNLGGYEIEIVNDELIITDLKGNIIEYRLKNGMPIRKEVQKLHKTLFHEKQTLIENCLFGVDINPKSVLICRLRLWIELLKNAYYQEPGYTELETLPNIDINIKCGNSLLSRFNLKEDVFERIPNFKKKLNDYKYWVKEYKNARDRNLKKQLTENIRVFTDEFKKRDPKIVKLQRDLDKKANNYYEKFVTQKLFAETANLKALKEKEKIEKEIESLTNQIEELKSDNKFKNAFEWRFEFPEVLNDDGNFNGFDVVIGNPPYFTISKNPELRLLQNSYQTFDSTGDIYCLFYERGFDLLKESGILFYITSNKWLRANYGQALREFFVQKTNPIFLFDFSWFQVFENASVDSNILGLQKTSPVNKVLAAVAEKDFDIANLDNYIESKAAVTSFPAGDYWTVKDETYTQLKIKVSAKGKMLSKWNFEIYRGILTGFNKAFIIDDVKKNELIKLDKRNKEVIKPLIRGRDVERYEYNFENLWLIFTRREINIDDYPTIKEYLKEYKDDLEPKKDRNQKRGRKPGPYQWYEIQDNTAYYKEFDKEKLIWAETMRVHKTGDRNFPRFGYDAKGTYPDKTIFIGTGSHLKYLLAFLNSSVGRWLIMEYVTKLDTGGYMMQKVFLDKIPIFVPSSKQEKDIIAVVDNILEAKKQNKDSKSLEEKIDHLVYSLYELTPDEQKIIEAQ